LQFVSIQRGSQDKLWWIPSKKGTFKVKDFFRALSKAEEAFRRPKIENLTEKMQKDIHEQHFAPKPHLFNIYNKKS
jgi:hypothetical protein